MGIVCVCNGITEKQFREAARKPGVKTHQDVLIAAGGKGKLCSVNCVTEGKRLIREEKAARVRDVIDVRQPPKKAFILPACFPQPHGIPARFMPEGAETPEAFRARHKILARERP